MHFKLKSSNYCFIFRISKIVQEMIIMIRFSHDVDLFLKALVYTPALLPAP